MTVKKPTTAAATLVKIERNTNRIAAAMERLAVLFEQSTFVYKPYQQRSRLAIHPRPTSND